MYQCFRIATTKYRQGFYHWRTSFYSRLSWKGSEEAKSVGSLSSFHLRHHFPPSFLSSPAFFVPISKAFPAFFVPIFKAFPPFSLVFHLFPPFIYLFSHLSFLFFLPSLHISGLGTRFCKVLVCQSAMSKLQWQWLLRTISLNISKAFSPSRQTRRKTMKPKWKQGQYQR